MNILFFFFEIEKNNKEVLLYDNPFHLESRISKNWSDRELCIKL